MNSAQQTLVSYGIRPSVQRIAILEYLQENMTHPTAEDIYVALSPSMPTLSKMTVYNTLNLLVAAGVIIALDIDGQFKRFDFDTTFHGHLKCKICGRIEDVYLGKNEDFRKLVKERQVDEAQLFMRGVCSACGPKVV